jgi:uncharacterized Zn ribbon protein
MEEIKCTRCNNNLGKYTHYEFLFCEECETDYNRINSIYYKKDHIGLLESPNYRLRPGASAIVVTIREQIYNETKIYNDTL